MSLLNSFTLGNAALAPFALLVCVPLVLHLFARARPPSYVFSSIEFIQRIVRKTIRLKKPQSWLVLLLRTLIFAGLVAMFLQPVFFGKNRLAGHFQKKNVVILVDASASMACMEGSQTRFATACGKASEVLSSLSESDSANIIWMRTPSRPEFPSLGVNHVHLQTVLRKASVSTEAADIHGAMVMALDMLKDPDAAREIYVISDFQKTAWTDFDPAVPEGIRLVRIQGAAAEVANQGVTRLRSMPAHPLLGEDVTAYCEVENFSSEPALRTVYLRAGETRLNQEVRLAPWSRSVVSFPCRFSTPGEHVITVSLSEDAFPLDNERYAVVDVQDFLKVAVLASEPVTADYWKRALDAAGWARVEMLTPERMDSKINADVLMLSGWDGRDSARVSEFLREGGMVVWYPGANVQVGDFTALAGVETTESARPLAWQKASKPHRLKIANGDDPVFAIFSKGANGDPTRGSILARYEIEPSLLPGSKPILQYEDGVPALVRVKDNVRLFVWNIPLQPEFSNWASQTEFLPFLNELVLHHRGEGAQHPAVDYMPGQLLLWQFGQEVVAKDVSLAHDEKPVEVRRQGGGQVVTYASEPAAGIGDYRWQLRSRLVGHSLVNFPVIESDLRTLTIEDLKKSNSVAIASGHSIEGLREGTRLWPLILLAILLLALGEGLVLLRAERT